MASLSRLAGYMWLLFVVKGSNALRKRQHEWLCCEKVKLNLNTICIITQLFSNFTFFRMTCETLHHQDALLTRSDSHENSQHIQKTVAAIQGTHGHYV